MKPKPLLRSFLPSAFAVASLSLSVIPAQAATYYKNDTTTLANPGDWTGTPGTADTCSYNTAAATITLANSINQTLGGSLSIAGLNFGQGLASNAFVINPTGSNTLTLNSSATGDTTAAIGYSSLSSVVINCPIFLNANATLRNNNRGYLTIGGSIGESGGSRNLTTNGVGLVNLSGANTYSGLTTVGSNSVLTLSGSGTIGNGTGGLTMSSSSWVDLGGTTQNVGGTVNFGANATIQNGTLNNNNAIAGGFFGGGVVSANLGGTAGLNTNNNSILVLSGNLSYTGATNIGNNAASTILSTKPLPSGVITLTGALVARVGGAGQWASTDIDSLLARDATNLVVASTGVLGFDTTDGDFTYANPISGPTPANLGLLKRGPNTLTLSGANTYAKATNIRAGTLKVDNTVAGSLNSSSPLTFSGSGTFNYNTASTAQSLGALTLSAGEGTVQLDRTGDTTLTFSSLAARTAGATANLSLSAGTPGATNGFILTGVAQGFVNQGLFFNGADYAYMDGAGTFVRPPVYGTDSGFTTANTITDSTHTLLTATPVSALNDTTINTLKLDGSGVGLTMNSGQTLTLANGGILKTGGGSAGTISGGNVQTTDSLRDIVVHTDSSSDSLTISSTLGAVAPSRTGSLTNASAVVTALSGTSDLYVGMVVYLSPGFTNPFGSTVAFTTIKTIDSGSQITLNNNFAGTTGSYTLVFSGNSLTKSGAGTLTLSGANNLVNVYLDGGRLNIANGAALGAGLDPSVYTGNNQNNPIGRLTINEGATIDNTSGSPLALDYKYNMTLNGSFTFVGTDDLTFINANGNGNLSVPSDLTITTSTIDKTLSILPTVNAVTSKLTKNGPGTLLLGRNSGAGMNGGVVVNEGVYGNPNGGASDCTYSGLLSLGDITPGNSRVAILYLIDSSAHSAPINVRAGSSGPLAMHTAGNPNIYSPTLLNNTLTLAADSARTLSHYGVIRGTGGLAIGDAASTAFTVAGVGKTLANDGTVALFNRNTYAGNTVINSGTLKLGALGTIDGSPLLSLAEGTSLDLSSTSGYTLGGSTALSASGTGTSPGTTAARIIGPSGGTVSLGAQGITLNHGFTPGGDTGKPCLYVSQGALTLNNNAITINGATLGEGIYRLIETTGTLNENVSPSYAVSGTAIDGTKTNVISSDGGGNLILTVTPGGGGITFADWKAANGNPVGGLGDDHDNDGVDNGTEFFLGGDTNTTGFTALPSVVNTAGTLSVTWTKHANYPGEYGTDFVVQTSVTLADPWTTETLGVNVIITDNDVKYTFPNPLGTKKFARLKVTGPN